MTQTCASCGKQFQNSVSLDRHGTSCSKKQRRPPVANLQAHQRSRIDPPDNGDDGPSEEPPTIRSARSGRAVCIPRRLLDYVPHRDMSLAHVPPHAPTPPKCDDRSVTPTIDEPSTTDQRPHPLQTEADKLGAFRRYTHALSWLLKNEQRLDLACDSSSIDVPPPPVNIEAIHEISRITSNPYEPFLNFSTAVFMAAYFSETNTKSEHHATSVAVSLRATISQA